MFISRMAELSAPLQRGKLRLFTEARALTFLFISGLALRLYQLGRDSFWYDEVVVASIAQSPTIPVLLQKIRTLAMTMPLDMLINWVVAHFSQTEAILRLPSALFGSLGILAAYFLFRQLVEFRPALLAAALLAVAPLHVHYSQELRFYASLVFFYCLSAGLLLRSLRRPSRFGWVVYTIVTIIGVYFHIYVLLSTILGLTWLLFHWRSFRLDRDHLISFALSQILILAASLPGYIYFGAAQSFAFPLFYPGSSFFREIGMGLGWIEMPYWENYSTGRLWARACLVFTALGLIDSLIHRRRLVSTIVLSVAIQISGIILADVLRNYWFVYRQLLALLPQVMLLTALGVVATGGWLAHLSRVVTSFLKRQLLDKTEGDTKTWRNRSGSSIPRPLVEGESRLLESARVTNVLTLAIFMVGLGALALSDYYPWQKSSAEEAVRYLAEASSPGEFFLVIPGYERRTIRYYLTRLGRLDAASALSPAEWDRLPDLEESSLRGILTNGPIPTEWSAILEEKGFYPALKYQDQGWLGHNLLLKHSLLRPDPIGIAESDRRVSP